MLVIIRDQNGNEEAFDLVRSAKGYYTWGTVMIEGRMHELNVTLNEETMANNGPKKWNGRNSSDGIPGDFSQRRPGEVPGAGSGEIPETGLEKSPKEFAPGVTKQKAYLDMTNQIVHVWRIWEGKGQFHSMMIEWIIDCKPLKNGTHQVRTKNSKGVSVLLGSIPTEIYNEAYRETEG